MLRVLWKLLAGLGWIVVGLVVGVLGALTLWAFMQVGLPWLGLLIAVGMSVSVGVHLGNMF